MQSRLSVALIIFIATLHLPSLAQPAHPAVDPDPTKLTECSVLAVYKYKGTSLIDDKPACKITVNRAAPGSPLPVQVPPKTKVLIIVDHQQANEIIQAAVTNDAVARPDIAGGIISKLTNPLASLQFTDSYNNAKKVQQFSLVKTDRVQKRQDEYYSALRNVYAGYVESSCLQAYVAYDEVKIACTATPIPTPAAFDDARKQAITDVKNAIDTEIPAATDISDLDGDVGDVCPNDTYADGSDCFKIKENRFKIDALFGLISAKEKATSLASYLAALTMWQRTGDTQLPVYEQPRDRRLTIKINGIEQVGSTSIAVASVTVTWQQTNWSLSTGVVLSALKNKTFADSPLYNADGTPNADGSGKTFTQVTVAKTYPGIISPVFLVNYRLYNFQASSGRLAILFSGGLGANIVTKSADFAAGPSLQWGSVIFSPVVHYGRQTQLTSGVHVGDQLGTSPPALPTVNAYKPAIGLGITYKLPLP